MLPEKEGRINMADFVTLFPTCDIAAVPESFGEIERTFNTVLGAKTTYKGLLGGAGLLTSSTFDRGPALHTRDDGSDWIIIKGKLFDISSGHEDSAPADLLDVLIRNDVQALNRFEGTFALAAWDARARRGWILNDQASMLDLFYAETEHGIYASTNVLALARALGCVLDPACLREFLARGVLVAPSSMFKGIRRVNIGEHLICRDGELRVSRHWSAYAEELDARNISATLGEFTELIASRIAGYADSSRSILCDLTGGLDSRLILAGASSIIALRLATIEQLCQELSFEPDADFLTRDLE